MKRNTLIIITLIYFSISLLYNYSLYPLIITNENSNQYFLIFLYFLSELFSFAFRKYAKKNEEKIVSTLGPIIFIEEPMSYSTLSESNNNLTTSMNISATYISTMQPFIGMKWPSFIFPAIFDFLSKFFIFHGLKILESDIIFRAIIELVIVFIFSKLMLQSKYNNFSIVGVIINFCSLVFVCFYFQIAKDLKLYFKYDNLGFIGMLLCVVGEFFSGIHIFFQIKYIRIGEKNCSREIAWEGVFGSIISFFVFLFSLLFPSYEKDYSKDEDAKKKFWYCIKDNNYNSFEYLFINNTIIIWYILFFLVNILNNLMGITLAKYIGEVYKASVNTGRISLMMILVLSLHNDDNFDVGNCIISSLFCIIIFIGLILSIFLRNERDIKFNESVHEINLKDDNDKINIIDDK